MTQIEETGADENSPMEGAVAKSARITIKELNQLIADVQEYPLQNDDKWFVVSYTWWSKVLETVKQGYVEDIPSIDNGSISDKSSDGYFLRANLAESIDFHLLPEPVFSRLRDVYGMEIEERDFIPRFVIEKAGKLVVEVYPRVVMVSFAADSSRFCVLRLQGSDTMVDLRDRALRELGLIDTPIDRMKFYISHGDKYELIDTSQQNLDNYFDTAQKVLVDVADENGKWFINNDKPKLFGGSSSNSFYDNPRERQATFTKGACGLQNLGNTCFMASALQCISNVPELTNYFLSDEYIKDINESNPLGTRGELARAYGELMHNMWSGYNSSFVPRKLKMTIGQLAPRFSGYAQQDSQELLAYLLDGLHEDLNRIKVKPYVPDDETLEKLEEHEQAEKSWQAYKARNDSIIVDKVHGQLKSTLVCPVCAKISIKFDPFCFLSVPLPPKEKVKQVVTLIFNQKRRWAKFTITVSPSTTVSDVVSTMKTSLQSNGNEFSGEMVLYSIGVGELSDEIRLLDPAEPIYTEDRSTSIYACQVDYDPTASKLVIVKNQTQTGRSLSLPMVFTLRGPDELNRGFLADTALKFITDTFHIAPIDSVIEGDDDSMNGEDRDPYKLFVMHGNTAIPFPSGRESSVAWPGGITVHTIVFQWRDQKLFNQYKGADLIDRECSVTTRKDIHLMECIDLFTKQEQLGEEDSWYCPKCKKHERASKKLDLWNLPEILIIHLKRFQYSKWHREKIDIPVVIPVREFELNSKLANERHEHVKYDLIAISHHMGGLGGGHYTASALNKTTGKWFDFNDSCVSKTSAPSDPIIGRTPYLLVYRRKETVPDSNFEMETDE